VDAQARHFGVFGRLILLDIPALEPLLALCAEEKRSDFLVTMAPLRIKGGTGSPVNPIAVF
jgi:kynurenine formamidase